MNGTTVAPAAPAGKGHPAGFYFIFCGEMAERFSYYGMRAILLLYLMKVLHFQSANANSIYSAFKFTCYFLPLLGGFLADRYFGKYWTIVGFSVPYVAGHFILGIDSWIALIPALLLLAGGSGVIKPNISTLMGMTYDQKRPGQEGLRTSAFLWFYFAVNIGATISLFALPLIRDRVAARNHHPQALLALSAVGGLAEPMGQPWAALASLSASDAVNDTQLPLAYKIAFQFPTWLMVIALIAFASGRRHYALEVIDRNPPPLSDEERRLRWQTLTPLLGIFGLIICFWIAYEQNDSLWIVFAEKNMDLTLNLGLFTTTFPPDGFQWTNGLLVLIFAPFFGTLFRRIDPHGTRYKATTKILVGFLFTGAASLVMAAAAWFAKDGGKVTVWWILIGYVVLTIGEVLLYGTGLELAYAAAPASMKSMITACFLLTNALGNFINILFLRLYNPEKYLSPQAFFALTAGVVFVAAFAFVFVGRRFNRARAAAPTTV